MNMIIDWLALRNEIAETHRLRIRETAEKRGGDVPKLAIVLVGNNPASASYVSQKEKYARETWLGFELVRLDENVSQKGVLDAIRTLNADPSIDAYMVQLPLPPHLDSTTIIREIDPRKDADGFHAVSLGQLFLGEPFLEPCTPKGVMRLLGKAGVDPLGKEAVVVGKSNIVGKPMAMMLSNAGATVTLCHKDTQDLYFHTKRADILVVATGVPHLVRAEHVKPGAVVIDVGFTKRDGIIFGDCDFAAIEPICAITPVPGGVGPMTVCMLAENTILAAEEGVTGRHEMGRHGAEISALPESWPSSKVLSGRTVTSYLCSHPDK